MLFKQVTAENPECVNHAPRWLLHVRGSALRTFPGAFPIWVHPPSSWIYLMPDPNMGEMGEAAVANLAPRARVTWITTRAPLPPGFDRDACMAVKGLNGPDDGEHHNGYIVSENRWSGWPDLGVRLTITDGNPRPWGVFRTNTDEREHLVVAPLAAGWPAWHTIDVETGAPGALFYHSTETWRAERPASGRRFVSEPPWLWIEGAFDAIPMEQTSLYTTSRIGPHIREVLRAKRNASGRLLDVDFEWLCEDGHLIFIGKNARAFTMNDEERAQIRGFLEGTMRDRVEWLRSLRAQLEALTPEARVAWRERALSWMKTPPKVGLPGSA